MISWEAYENEEKYGHLETKLFNELVPSSGISRTEEGEILRALGRIVYRYFNDGDVCYEGYGRETTGRPLTYLYRRGDKLKGIETLIRDINTSDYVETLQKIRKIVVDYITSRKEYTPNNSDMWEEKDWKELLTELYGEDQYNDDQDWKELLA